MQRDNLQRPGWVYSPDRTNAMDPQLRGDLDRNGIGSVRYHASLRELLDLYLAFYGMSPMILILRDHIDEREGIPSIFCRC